MYIAGILLFVLNFIPSCFTWYIAFYIEFYTEFTSKLANNKKNVKEEYITNIAFCLFYPLIKIINWIPIFFF